MGHLMWPPWFLRENFQLLVDPRKERSKRSHRFRHSQKQKAFRLECVMKCVEHPLLHLLIEVDQEIAATDQISARERRIGNHILAREHTHFANRLADAIAAVFFDKESMQSFRRDVLHQTLRIKTGARLFE